MQDSSLSVLDHLARLAHKGERPPTVREIQSALGFKSPRSVSYHLEKLEAQRLIENKGHSRGWMLTPEGTRTLGKKSSSPPPIPPDRPWIVPFFQSIPAGAAQLSDPSSTLQESLELSPAIFSIRDKSNVFAIKIKGDSMSGAGIQEGDIGIFEIREPKENEIVAALIDGESTLKRLQKSRGRFILHAENPRYPDLIPDQCLSVQGVMVGLIRKISNTSEAP